MLRSTSVGSTLRMDRAVEAPHEDHRCHRDTVRLGRDSGDAVWPPQRAVRSGDWKLLFDGPRALLFNLRTDIGERNNVIGERPDIARRLRPLLAAWQADVEDEAKRATPR